MSLFSFFRRFAEPDGHGEKNLPSDVLSSKDPNPWLRALACRVATLSDARSSEAFLNLDLEIRSWRTDYLADNIDPFLSRSSEKEEEYWFPPSMRLCPSASLSEEKISLYVCCLFSMANSGFERERLVTLLAETKAVEALPFLLVRTCDWVPQVRAAALKAIHSLLQQEETAVLFIPFAGLIHRLEKFVRRDEKLFSRLRQLIGSDACAEAVEYAFKTLHFRDRRALLEFSASWSAERRIAVARAVVRHDRDGVMRCRAASFLLETSEEKERNEWIRHLVEDRLTRLSYQAIHAALAAGFADIDDLLIKALFHRGRSVQRMAAFYLKDRTGMSAADVYRRELCKEEGRHKAALQALSWCGDKKDVVFAKKFLSSEEPDLYAAAFALLCAFDASGHWQEILSHAVGDSQRLRKIAVATLRKHAAEIDEDLIWAVLEGGTFPDSACTLLSILMLKDRWSSLRLVLRTFDIPSLVDPATQAFAEWYQSFCRVGGKPASYEAEAINTALIQSGSVVPEQIRISVLEILGKGN